MSRWLALVVKRRVCGHVLVDQRHGANNHVVPNGKGVGDDATVGTHAYVVTNVQVIVFKAKGFIPATTTLAYAVNIGGFGFALGSMANLISLTHGLNPTSKPLRFQPVRVFVGRHTNDCACGS